MWKNSFILHLINFVVLEESCKTLIPLISTLKHVKDSFNGKSMISISYGMESNKTNNILINENNEISFKLKLLPTLGFHPLFNLLQYSSQLIISLIADEKKNESVYQYYNMTLYIMRDDPISGEPLILVEIDNRDIYFDSLPSHEAIVLPKLSPLESITNYIGIKFGHAMIKSMLPITIAPFSTILVMIPNNGDEFKTAMSYMRNTRGVDNYHIIKILPCRRFPLYVEMKLIGWDSWVLAPATINIFHCLGSCSHYNSFNMNITANALVRALLKSDQMDINGPCCIPSQLKGVDILTKNKNKVEVTKINDLIVNSCSCQ